MFFVFSYSPFLTVNQVPSEVEPVFILLAVLCTYPACGAAWDERGSSENCFLFGLVAPKPASLSHKSAVGEIHSILKLEGNKFFILPLVG